MNFTPRRRRAITLPEVLLGLAISAVVALGVGYFYFEGLGANSGLVARDELNDMVGNTRSFAAGFGDYSGLTDTVAAQDATASTAPIANKAHLFPGNMIGAGATTDTQTIHNPWGGAVSITTGTGGSTFIITEERVPDADCQRMISVNTTGMGGAMTSISVNGGTITLPVTVDTAQANCNKNASGATTGNEVAFTSP